MIVFDTNALLDIYNLSEDSIVKVIEFLDAISSKIFLPYQVYDEFLKHYKSRRGRADNQLKEFGKEYKKNSKSLEEGIQNITVRHKRYESKFQDCIDELAKTYKRIKKKMDKEVSAIEGKYKRNITDDNDMVLDFVKSLYSSKTPKDFSMVEKFKLASDADLRFKFGLAPGYTDEDKNDKKDDKPGAADDKFRPYGDYFIWSQVLNALKVNPDNLCFITAEKKIDWWKDEKRNEPAQILVEEFEMVCSGKNFRIQSMLTFLKNAIDDQAIKAEVNGLLYLLPKVRACREKSILINVNTIGKVQELLENNFYEDIHNDLCENTTSIGGYPTDVYLEDAEQKDIRINDCNFDEATYMFSVEAEIDWECSGSCTLEFSRDYATSEYINFTVTQLVVVSYVIILNEDIAKSFVFEEIEYADYYDIKGEIEERSEYDYDDE